MDAIEGLNVTELHIKRIHNDLLPMFGIEMVFWYDRHSTMNCGTRLSITNATTEIMYTPNNENGLKIDGSSGNINIRMAGTPLWRHAVHVTHK